MGGPATDVADANVTDTNVTDTDVTDTDVTDTDVTDTDVTDRAAVTDSVIDRGEVAGRPVDGRGPRVGDAARRVWRAVPDAWRHALGLFLGTKLVLTATGLVALHAYDAFLRSVTPDGVRTGTDAAKHAISPHQWYSMWFAWDSFLYERTTRARPGFDWDLQFGQAPLYPLLGRLVAVPLGGHTFAALLLVSNVAFLLALYYGYRLVERFTADRAEAARFTRYLVLAPTAFLLQAALTESLFLALLLACCYHAERRRWLLVGALGFPLALSRSLGFMMVVPLALILLRQGGYRLGPRALLGYLRTGYPLLAVPAGWLAFMAYCRWQTGDWFRYQHVQERGYSIATQNPLRTVWDGLTLTDTVDAVRMWFAVGYLALAVLALRYARPAYVACGLLLVLVPLAMGPQVYRSLLRYLVVVFPVCLVLAAWGRRPEVDRYLGMGLAVLQGVLWVTWLTYWSGFIV